MKTMEGFEFRAKFQFSSDLVKFLDMVIDTNNLQELINSTFFAPNYKNQLTINDPEVKWVIKYTKDHCFIVYYKYNEPNY